MRIGIDTRLLHYDRGGISQYILQLIQTLREGDAKNQYHLFSSRKGSEDYRPDGSSNFFQHPVWTPSHNRLERWALGIEVAPYRLDVFHSPDFIPPGFGARRRLITIHDLNFLLFPEYVNPESHRYYTQQIKWAVQEADHISADSHQTRLDLIELLKVSADKVTTVHLAAKPLFTRVQSRPAIISTLEKYNIPAGFILFVGTLTPRKNVRTLILAYNKMLQESGIDVPLILIGSKGWQYENLASTIEELRLSKKIQILDNVTDEELARLYSSAGAFALPSYYEGFGLPPLEAMQCGCPVIVSDRGSLPEIVGEAGIILDPDAVDDWAESLVAVLASQEVRENLIRAGNSQAKKFSWQKTAKATLELYKLVTNFV
jgi:glycosyltransferase involved in cell wall biosynthesis